MLWFCGQTSMRFAESSSVLLNKTSLLSISINLILWMLSESSSFTQGSPSCARSDWFTYYYCWTNSHPSNNSQSAPPALSYPPTTDQKSTREAWGASWLPSLPYVAVFIGFFCVESVMVSYKYLLTLARTFELELCLHLKFIILRISASSKQRIEPQ